MAVLYVPHFVQFFDNDGDPLADGELYTYAAGTDTPKATYTTAAGNIELPNPVPLDASGRAVIFITGSYKYVLKDALGNIIRTTDNVTSFNASTLTNEGFFQSFSGNAVAVDFTTSESLGSDEKALMVFSELEYSTNGTYASDTGWTKGAGWTIAAGVATATGAISTALEQPAGITIIQGKSYLVQYTVTRSAGSITPNLGGTAGTARSASGTYSEVIIPGSTQTISFTTSGFTGTLDNVSVRDVGGLSIRNPADYTINGTQLSFVKAPAIGTNNIFVFAPYTLIGAAGAAQTAADNAIAAQLAAESAVGAVAFKYTFDNSTTMGDPGAGQFRFNNATIASATAIAFDASSAESGNPNVSAAILSITASTSPVKGQVKITKYGEAQTFAVFNISAIADNTGWLQATVTYVSGSGTFTDNDFCYLQMSRTGDLGAQGPTGTISGATLQTPVNDDKVLFLDTSSSDALSYATALNVVATTLLDEDNMASDSATRAPTQQSVKAYVDTSVAAVVLPYTSTALTIAAAGSGTLAHSLGANPDFVQAFITCTSAEGGYSVGNTVFINPAGNDPGDTQNRGIMLQFDATNIYYKIGSATKSLTVMNKTNGDAFPITNASWTLTIKAFKLT